jgi:hypothetical protein
VRAATQRGAYVWWCASLLAGASHTVAAHLLAVDSTQRALSPLVHWIQNVVPLDKRHFARAVSSQTPPIRLFGVAASEASHASGATF